MPPLSDLALMIQSRYPFIAVETSEEERLETMLAELAADLRVPFFVWTVTNGLHRHGLPNAIYDSQPPLDGRCPATVTWPSGYAGRILAAQRRSTLLPVAHQRAASPRSAGISAGRRYA